MADEAADVRWCKKCKAVFAGSSCASGHPNFMYSRNIPSNAGAPDRRAPLCVLSRPRRSRSFRALSASASRGQAARPLTPAAVTPLPPTHTHTPADTTSVATVEETVITFRTRLIIKGHTDKDEAKVDVAKGLEKLAWDVSKGRALLDDLCVEGLKAVDGPCDVDETAPKRVALKRAAPRSPKAPLRADVRSPAIPSHHFPTDIALTVRLWYRSAPHPRYPRS